MMSTISVRNLGPNNDPLNGDGVSNFLTDLDAVAQIIYTRLRLFRGEWWENPSLGTPWFQSLLGQPGSANSLVAMSTILVNEVLTVPFVLSAKMTAISYNPNGNGVSFIMQVSTQFGSLTIGNQGGAA
jgi:hypothetical protein